MAHALETLILREKADEPETATAADSRIYATMMCQPLRLVIRPPGTAAGNLGSRLVRLLLGPAGSILGPAGSTGHHVDLARSFRRGTH